MCGCGGRCWVVPARITSVSFEQIFISFPHPSSILPGNYGRYNDGFGFCGGQQCSRRRSSLNVPWTKIPSQEKGEEQQPNEGRVPWGEEETTVSKHNWRAKERWEGQHSIVQRDNWIKNNRRKKGHREERKAKTVVRIGEGESDTTQETDWLTKLR